MTQVAILWHMHQPFYEDLVTHEHILPWVRLHGLKDYYGMAALLREFPEIRLTFNLVPSLLVQLEAFAAGRARDRFLDVGLAPAAELTPADAAFMIQHFFHAHRERMIEAYPRYAELLAKREESDSGNKGVAYVLGTALIAGSFSMNGGGTILGGGTIRMRFYGQYGLDGAEIAKLTGYLLIAGWLGHALLAGLLLCGAPPELPWLPAATGRGLGVLLLLSCGALVVLSVTGWRGRKIAFLPPLKLLAVTMGVSALDWLFAGLALRAFLPLEISTPAFLAVTAVGQALGAASHVPGGVGVMELSISKLAAGMEGGT